MEKDKGKERIIIPELTWNTRIGLQLLHLNLALRTISNEIEAFDFSRMN